MLKIIYKCKKGALLNFYSRFMSKSKSPMKYYLLILSFSVNCAINAATPTWSSDIAKILHTKCAKCHNPNGIGKFSLLTYNDAFVYSSSIKNAAVTKGSMPPWPPRPKYVHYKDERVLSGTEKKMIADWVDAGAPSGDLNTAPTPPVFSKGSALSSVDLSLRMPVYASQATSSDLYRCFILDPALTENKKIEEIEIIPGNINIVHHVLIYQDTTTKPAQLDAADPGEGYTSFGGIGSNAAVLIGAWVPGSSPKKIPYGMAMTLFKKSKIVLQIHYPRGTNGALDSTRINIRYSNHPSPREVFFSPILNEANIKNYPSLVIPKDSIRTFVQEFTIPLVDFSMLSIAPHMHLVGKSYKVYAVTPAGDTIKGIDIPNWDFHWQDEYTFKKIQKIPVGSKLYGIATYDNTSANLNNPNSPTKTITRGEATNDEMMLTFVSYMIYQAGDENIVVDSSADIDTDMPKVSAVTQTNLSESLAIYPNPVQENLEVIIEAQSTGNIKFDIYSLDGKKVNRKTAHKSLSLGMNRITLSVDNLIKGEYILRGETNEGFYSKNFIKL